MTIEWCFVRESNGNLYVIDSPPDRIFKGKTSWCRKANCFGSWRQVFEQDGKIQQPTGKGLFTAIDFSNVPLPKWEDEHPIVIVQHITQTYYTLD